MPSFDTYATIGLVVILAALVFINRHKLSFSRFGIFYAAMYRTTAGLVTMDNLAKRFKRFWEVSAVPIIVVGFIGMAIVVGDIGYGLFKILTQASTPSVGIVLPIEAKGVFYVPFFYWILSIFIILVIHEGMHGVMARVYNLPVKNSGLVVLGALVPLIPGAFVEPDEKRLARAKPKEQLAVYAAGPVSNLVTGLLFLALFAFVMTPATQGFYANDGVVITELMDGESPARLAGIEAGEKIVAINGESVGTTEDFKETLAAATPGDALTLVTSNTVYDVTLGTNPENKKAWLGVFVENELHNPTWYTYVVLWFKDLLYWLALLSLGVGLFNLVPLGPIDGGRMLLCALQSVTHETHATTVWKSVSFVVLGILITNLVLAFV